MRSSATATEYGRLAAQPFSMVMASASSTPARIIFTPCLSYAEQPPAGPFKIPTGDRCVDLFVDSTVVQDGCQNLAVKF
jgi:hypothetical protein